MKTKILYFIYPFFCLLPIVILAYLLLINNSPLYIAPVIYVFCIIAVILLERIIPWKESWNKNDGDLTLDLQHIIGNLSVSAIAFSIYSLLYPIASNIRFNFEINILVQYALGLLIFDFGLYYVHRLSHIHKFLWKLHAIHHSSERIYFLNGQKRHLLHEMLEGLPGFIILFLLGVSPIVLLCIVYSVNIHLLFQHANVRYKAGIFKNIFSVAELHRWHHQRDWKDVQGNYGAIFSFWDRLLGTLLNKSGEANEQVGLDDSPELVRLSYLNQHKWPFKVKS